MQTSDIDALDILRQNHFRQLRNIREISIGVQLLFLKVECIQIVSADIECCIAFQRLDALRNGDLLQRITVLKDVSVQCFQIRIIRQIDFFERDAILKYIVFDHID